MWSPLAPPKWYLRPPPLTFKQAREDSDYIREVDERSYPYFQELFSKSSAAVREWLEWNDEESRFKNVLNFNEFVGWLYPRPTGEDGADARGNFDIRRLGTRDDVRNVAYLLKNADKFFQQFRNGQPIGATYAMATTEIYQKKLEESTDRVRTVFNAISACTKALDDIPYKVFRDAELKLEFEEKLSALERAVAALK